MAQLNWKRLEEYGVLIGMITAAVIYAFAVFTYAHGTFLTKDEANVRKEARDKEIISIDNSLKSIDGKLDILLMERRRGR